jgi:hypothetical protein
LLFHSGHHHVEDHTRTFAHTKGSVAEELSPCAARPEIQGVMISRLCFSRRKWRSVAELTVPEKIICIYMRALPDMCIDCMKYYKRKAQIFLYSSTTASENEPLNGTEQNAALWCNFICNPTPQSQRNFNSPRINKWIRASTGRV